MYKHVLGEGLSHTLLAAKGLVRALLLSKRTKDWRKRTKEIKAITEPLRRITNNERYGRWLFIEFCSFFCNKNGWQFWDSSPCENGERRLCLPCQPCWLCSLQLFTNLIVPRDMPGAIVETIVSSTNVPGHLRAGQELRSCGRRNYFKLCQQQQRPKASALFSN